VKLRAELGKYKLRLDVPPATERLKAAAKRTATLPARKRRKPLERAEALRLPGIGGAA